MGNTKKTRTIAKSSFVIALAIGFYFLVFALSAKMQSKAETSGQANLSPQYVAVSNGQAAKVVLGQPDFTTSSPGTSSTKFNVPYSIAIDPTTQKVFVADLNRVLRFSSVAAATNGGEAEAVLGQPDFTSNAPATTRTGMDFPTGLAVDSAGRLWVADGYNVRLLRFDNAANKPNGAPADGVLGQPDFTSKVPATTQNGMSGPAGIAIDSAGRLYAADFYLSRVLRFDNAASKPNGAPADGVLGQPNFTTSVSATTQNGMYKPLGVATDSVGRLYVADTYNNRVLRFDNAASKLNGAPADGVLGQPNFTSFAPATTQNGMRSPSGIATDSDGRLYVAEFSNSRVVIFNNAATLPNYANASNVLGQPDFNTGISGTSASKLTAPYLLYFDETTNNLFVADSNNNRVLRFNIAGNSVKFDYDGDGKSDVSVFRPSDGVWYLLNSKTGFTATQFGISTDKMVPADYDGDGKTDIAVWRAGTWYLLRSSSGFATIQFGSPGDIPLPADFDGDGNTDFAVFRPSNGVWYVFNLATNAFNAVQFGAAEDKPVVADYDRDGKADYAVFRPSNGVWHLLQSTKGFSAVQFGISTDKPVVGDYDGDGKADEAVYRPENGTWYLFQSSKGFSAIQFGISTDLPAPADYDGDEKTDIAVYRDGIWYILKSTAGFASVSFGAAADKSVPNAFVP